MSVPFLPLFKIIRIFVEREGKRMVIINVFIANHTV